MKKLMLLCLCVILLVGCASDDIHDSFAAYRHQTAAQLYHAANKDIKKGNYDTAVEKLEALNALYPFGVYAPQGQINLMYAYYKNDDPDAAIAMGDRYLHLYPQGEYASYAYYMKGVIAFGQGFTWLQKKVGVDPAPRDLINLKAAFISFDELVRLFPNSAYTPDALARMYYIRNVMAEKELGVARFYMARKAYVAAANRASEVVEHYAHTPSVIPALVIMVKSYRQLGLTQQADNTLKIFQASYPDAKQLKKLERE